MILVVGLTTALIAVMSDCTAAIEMFCARSDACRDVIIATSEEIETPLTSSVSHAISPASIVGAVMPKSDTISFLISTYVGSVVVSKIPVRLVISVSIKSRRVCIGTSSDLSAFIGRVPLM